MIYKLDWKNLKDRRKDIRLTMLYKIINEIEIERCGKQRNTNTCK